MKKFSKKLLFPLAIATMGITSCKPYAMTWHIITKDKAYQSITSIKNKQETLKFPRPCSLSYNYSHLRNGNYVSFIYGFIDYDYDNEYLKILDAELDSSQGEIECHILYMLKGQDGKNYRYVPTNDPDHTKKEVTGNFKNEIEDEVENDTLVTSPEYCVIGHFDFKRALCGHIFIERKTKEMVDYFDYNENVLDEINHYVTTSDKISSEHKGSSTITSEYYFQHTNEKYIPVRIIIFDGPYRIVMSDFPIEEFENNEGEPLWMRPDYVEQRFYELYPDVPEDELV